MKELELYLHIPFCMKKCNYCDFLSGPGDSQTQERYVKALCKEIRYYGSCTRDYQVTTVFIGGGTPSWLEESCMTEIMDAVRENFSLVPDAEITIECNPGTITEHKFEAYQKAGINRLSIGLQSANDEELKLLGRVHTFRQFLKTYQMAREQGFTNINVDLISCLPGQRVENFHHTLREVIRLKPEHISAYSLIIEEGTPFFQTYGEDVKRQQAGKPTEFLPDEDTECEMTRMTQQVLEEAGYLQYEISNFAKPGYACRHNLGYWQRKNYLGFGIGAASLLENVRYSNTRDMETYMKQMETACDVGQEEGADLHEEITPLSRKEQMEEFMFLGLRMIEGIAVDDFFREFGTTLESVYQKPCEKLLEEGMLQKKDGHISLTQRGMEVSNYVLADFLL